MLCTSPGDGTDHHEEAQRHGDGSLCNGSAIGCGVYADMGVCVPIILCVSFYMILSVVLIEICVYRFLQPTPPSPPSKGAVHLETDSFMTGTYIYIYIYIHVCLCVCVCVYASFMTGTYIYIYIYIHVCLYVCVCVFMHHS